MSKKSLSASMNRSETALGFAWWLFQLILLPSMMRAINGTVSRPLTDAELNFTYFLINFIAIVCIFHRFLGSSASYTLSHPVLFLESVVLGAVAYALCAYLMNQFLAMLAPGFSNQNDASIAALGRSSFYLTAVGTIILVPPAEECFYRELIFRTVYKHSHAAAYVVSICVFSLIHIAGFIGLYTPLELVLSFLQYVPAGLCLAWSFQRSGTIFAPILIHAMVNAYGICNLR